MYSDELLPGKTILLPEIVQGKIKNSTIELSQNINKQKLITASQTKTDFPMKETLITKIQEQPKIIKSEKPIKKNEFEESKNSPYKNDSPNKQPLENIPNVTERDTCADIMPLLTSQTEESKIIDASEENEEGKIIPSAKGRYLEINLNEISTGKEVSIILKEMQEAKYIRSILFSSIATIHDTFRTSFRLFDNYSICPIL